MKSETVTLSDGTTRTVHEIPSEKYVWVFKRFGGIITKQRPTGATPEEAITRIAQQLFPDMVENCGASLEGLAGDDLRAMVAAVLRVNQMDCLFAPLSFGCVAMNAKGYLSSLKQFMSGTGLGAKRE